MFATENHPRSTTHPLHRCFVRRPRSREAVADFCADLNVGRVADTKYMTDVSMVQTPETDSINRLEVLVC